MSNDSVKETVTAFSEVPPTQKDNGLVRRIIAAYVVAVRDFAGHGQSMWSAIGARSDEMHRLLVAGDEAAVSNALRNPHTTDLFYGFDNLTRTIDRTALAERSSGLDNLVRLASATGAIRLPNPGVPRPEPVPGIEGLLAALDRRFGFIVDFPNPYPFEWGLRTSRGVASYRAVHAIYQAWRLSELRGGRRIRILEIGAGLGRTAYYARKFGLDDYTIVDLPLTNAAQAHFLGTAIAPAAVVLVGEPAPGDAIRILGPRFISETQENFDIVLNVDSFTELDRRVAESYFTFAAKHARYFLSVNHEHNPFTFVDMAGTRPGSPASSRFPYWMRNGYVEELVDFASYGGDRSIAAESATSNPRRDLVNRQYQFVEQQETIDYLRRKLSEVMGEAAASRRILASRSRVFAWWLHLLRTKAR
jgi:hypothetical protein